MNIIKMIKGLVVAAMISALGFAANAADSKKPTRIPVHNWSSQIVMAYVIGGILEDMGYPNWVAEKGLCPGLPDWEALKAEACWKNFVTPDSGGKIRKPGFRISKLVWLFSIYNVTISVLNNLAMDIDSRKIRP